VAEGLQRTFLQRIAESKLKDAEVLLANERFSSAYYLAGYVIELGLKACIARRMQPETIPDKALVMTTYQHNFKALVGAAGLTLELEEEQANKPVFAEYWAITGGWSPEARYEMVERYSAQVFVQAINDPDAGILRWIRQHW
jgi:hypothetical protein